MGAYKIIAVSCKAKELKKHLQLINIAYKNGLEISKFVKK